MLSVLLAATAFGPGLHFFDSDRLCPLAGVGTRGERQCNRMQVKDPDTKVWVSRERGQIIIENTKRYAGETPIVDLILLGRGRDTEAASFPLGLHLRVTKQGGDFDSDLHVHFVTRERIASAGFDPYSVAVSDGARQRVVLSPAIVDKAVHSPPSASRVAQSLLSIDDHLEGKPAFPKRAGYKVADFSVGVGRGLLSKHVARAELRSLSGDNAPLIATRDLRKMLEGGAWSLRITKLSSLMPDDIVRDDLRLLGLDRLAVLQPAMKGLKKGQSLVFTLRAGSGTVGIDDAQVELPGAKEVARRYLELHWMGAIIAQQARKRR